MKKLVYAASGVVTPLGIAGAIAYKAHNGQTADPIFFLLLAILPASLLTGVDALRQIRPPARVRFAWGKGIRAKHWEQAQGGDPRRVRPVTSVVVPLRLANRDVKRSITLAEVTVRDRLSDTTLSPPPPTRVMFGGEPSWTYMACETAFSEVLNADQIVVAPASFKDTAVVIQDSGAHRERYNLDVRFRDNYGRTYRERIALRVADHGYQYETTEQVGHVAAKGSGA